MDDSGSIGAPPPPPPVPPPGGGGDALPPRDLGGIISTAVQIYTKNAQKLIMIVAIVVVPLNFISNFLSGVVFAPKKSTVTILGQSVTTVEARSAGEAILVALIAGAIGIIISAVLQAAILRAGALAALGDPIDVEASYRYGLKRVGSVIGASILIAIAVAVGFVLLIVPGVILLTMFAVAIPALVVEGKGATDAMSRSWQLVKGHFWHVLGVIVVAFLIVAIVSGIITAIGGSSWFLRWIFGSIGQIITSPFSALVSIMLYLDLRGRVESITAAAFRAELAAHG
jgi:hypothetical protein